MSGGPRYETQAEHLKRVGNTDTFGCLDCGVLVTDTTAHTRFHSILSSTDALAEVTGDVPAGT